MSLLINKSNKAEMRSLQIGYETITIKINIISYLIQETKPMDPEQSLYNQSQNSGYQLHSNLIN